MNTSWVQSVQQSGWSRAFRQQAVQYRLMSLTARRVSSEEAASLVPMADSAVPSTTAATTPRRIMEPDKEIEFFMYEPSPGNETWGATSSHYKTPDRENIAGNEEKPARRVAGLLQASGGVQPRREAAATCRAHGGPQARRSRVLSPTQDQVQCPAPPGVRLVLGKMLRQFGVTRFEQGVMESESAIRPVVERFGELDDGGWQFRPDRVQTAWGLSLDALCGIEM